MKSVALVLLFVAPCWSLEQFTADKADWSTLNDKAVGPNSKNTDHSPDGVWWIARETWQEWDGTVYNPANHSKADFVALICHKDTIRGIRTLFYDNNPFADIKNPTKAEVDNWHAMALNHVRAMVGYTGAEYTIKPDKCLHIRALWSDERYRTRMWDTAEYPGTCDGDTNPHCGASFRPSVTDQQPYLPAGIDSCGGRAGSEGLFSAAKSNIPWSIKWIRPFCQTLGSEGFWGGHTGPWFHRSEFGWNWWDMDVPNQNSNAGLRAKWSGKSGKVLYENPDITSGKFLVKAEAVNPNPRFPGYECEGILWKGAADSATKCYEQMLADATCGKRFMTYNVGNSGCACYKPDMAVCEPKMVAQRQTWDFQAVASSFGGFYIDTDKKLTRNALPYSGRVCENIIWKTGAGDASHCLQKIIESNYSDCGTKYITFNANGGGCACYPPEQTTCSKTTGQAGRQTFELELDASTATGGTATSGTATTGTDGTATTGTTSGTTGATTGAITTTTTIAETSAVLSGSLQLSVEDAAAFVNDTVAKNAVAEGIAAVVGVQVSYVTVVFSVAGRRLTSRHLAGTVKVDYTITIPPGSSVSSAAAMSALAAATVAELTTAIQAKVAAKGLRYTVTVTSKTSASSSGTSSGMSSTGDIEAANAASDNRLRFLFGLLAMAWSSASL